MSTYTQLHRSISYAVGDDHARRLMWLIRTYCKVFRVGKGQVANLEALI